MYVSLEPHQSSCFQIMTQIVHYEITYGSYVLSGYVIALLLEERQFQLLLLLYLM